MALPCDLVIPECTELSTRQQVLMLQHGHDDMLREVCRACHSLGTLLREAADARRGPGGWGGGKGPAGQQKQFPAGYSRCLQQTLYSILERLSMLGRALAAVRLGLQGSKDG